MLEQKIDKKYKQLDTLFQNLQKPKVEYANQFRTLQEIQAHNKIMQEQYNTLQSHYNALQTQNQDLQKIIQERVNSDSEDED